MSERIRREPDLPALYSVFGSYKCLTDFYADHLKVKSESEIRKRMEYIRKNKIKQMNEMETLKWVIGESIFEENINETKDIA